MEKKTDRLNIRVTPEFTQKLEELAKTWGLSKTSTLTRLVYTEWQRTTEMGRKEIADVINQFQILQDKITKVTEPNNEK